MSQVLFVVTTGDVLGIVVYFVAMAVIGKIIMAIPAVKKLSTEIIFKLIDKTVTDDKIKALLKEAIIRKEIG